MHSRLTDEQIIIPEEKSTRTKGSDVFMILLILALLAARAGSGIFNVFKFNERVQHVFTGNSDSNIVRSIFDTILGTLMLISVSTIIIVSRGFNMYRNYEKQRDKKLEAPIEVKQSPELDDVMEIKPLPAAFNPTNCHPGIQSNRAKRLGYRWSQFFNNFYVWTGSGPSAILSVGSIIKLLQLLTSFKFDSTCSKNSSHAWEIALAHLATFFVFAANVYSFKTYNTEVQRMYYKDLIIRKRVFEQKDSFMAACKKLFKGDWRSFLLYFQADELFPDSQLTDSSGQSYLSRNSRLYPERKLEDGILLDRHGHKVQVKDNKIQNSSGMITVDDIFTDKNKRRIYLKEGKFYVEEEDTLHENSHFTSQEMKHAVTKSAWHAINMIDRGIILGGTALSSIFIYYSQSILIEELRTKTLCHIHAIDKPGNSFMTAMSTVAAISNAIVNIQMTGGAVYNREEAKRVKLQQEKKQDVHLLQQHHKDEQEAKKVFGSKQKYISFSIIMNAINMFMGTFVALGTAPEKMSNNKALSDSIAWSLSITLIFALFSFINQKALDEEAVEREKLARYTEQKDAAALKQHPQPDSLQINGTNGIHVIEHHGQQYAPLNEHHIELNYDEVSAEIFDSQSSIDNIKPQDPHENHTRHKSTEQHYQSIRNKLYNPRMFTSASTPSNAGDESDTDEAEYKASLANSFM